MGIKPQKSMNKVKSVMILQKQMFSHLELFSLYFHLECHLLLLLKKKTIYTDTCTEEIMLLNISLILIHLLRIYINKEK